MARPGGAANQRYRGAPAGAGVAPRFGGRPARQRLNDDLAAGRSTDMAAADTVRRSQLCYGAAI